MVLFKTQVELNEVISVIIHIVIDTSSSGKTTNKQKNIELVTTLTLESTKHKAKFFFIGRRDKTTNYYFSIKFFFPVRSCTSASIQSKPLKAISPFLQNCQVPHQLNKRYVGQ